MISAGMPRVASASARPSDRAVLPLAVEPATTISGGRPSGEDIRLILRFDKAATQRERAGMVDMDPDGVADQGRVSGEVDELVVPGAAGQSNAPLPCRARQPRRRRHGLVILVRTGSVGFEAAARWRDLVDQNLDIAAKPLPVAIEPDS